MVGSAEACLVLVAMDDWQDLVDDMMRAEMAEDPAWIDEKPLRRLALVAEEVVWRSRRLGRFCGWHMMAPHSRDVMRP